MTTQVSINPRGSVGNTSDQLIGKEGYFLDIDPSDKLVLRTNRVVRGFWCKNVNGSALLPARTVVYKAAKFFKEFDAYGAADARVHGVIDNLLPSTGVPNNEYCWIFVEGPHELTSDGSGALAQGDGVMSVASGQVKITDTTPGSDTLIFKQLTSFCGICTETVAATSGLKFLAELGISIQAA